MKKIPDLRGLSVDEAKDVLDSKGIKYEKETEKIFSITVKKGSIVKIEEVGNTVILYESNRNLWLILGILAVLMLLGLSTTFGSGIYKSIKDQIIEIGEEDKIGEPVLEAERGWGKKRKVVVVKDPETNKKIEYYEYCIRENLKEECDYEKTNIKGVVVTETGHKYVSLRAVLEDKTKSKEATKEVYVDNATPEIGNFKITGATTNSIKVKTDAIDKHSGIDKYMYSLDGKTYQEGKEEYTYQNLKLDEKYTLYLKVIDKVGNESIVSIEVNSLREILKNQNSKEKEWDTPKINLDKIPLSIDYKDAYELPSYYDFGNDTGVVECLVDGEKKTDTNGLKPGKHTIECTATSSHNKKAYAEKIINVEINPDKLTEEELLELGYILLTLYYPKNSTNWEWIVSKNDGTDDIENEWQEYRGPILVKLSDVQYVYTRYELEGQTFVIGNTKTWTYVSPEKKVLEAGEKTKVKIYYDSSAVKKLYRIGNGPWQVYKEEFEVGPDTTIESKVISEIKVYDELGEYLLTQRQTNYHTVTVYQYSHSEPSSSQTGVNGNYRKINIDGEDVYVDTSVNTIPSYKEELEQEGKEVEQKEEEKTSINNVINTISPQTDNKLSVVINANPSGLNNYVDKVEITIEYDERAEHKYYQINDGGISEYRGKFYLTESALIKAWAIKDDMYGEAKAQIGYIEGSIAQPFITYSPSDLAEEVEVRIEYDPKSTIKKYKINNGLWQEYTNEFKIRDNCVITAYNENEFGHNAESSVVINNIVHYNVLERDDYYLIYVNYPEDAPVSTWEYKWKENGTWKKYESEYGIMLIKPQAANKIITEDGVKALDKNNNEIIYHDHYYVMESLNEPISQNLFIRFGTQAVEGPQIVLSTEEKTETVEVAISYNKTHTNREYKIIKPDGTDTGWMPYDKSFTVEENGTIIKARSLDPSGEWSRVSEKEIKNIDKMSPTITVTGNLETLVLETTLNVSVTDSNRVELVGYCEGETFDEDKAIYVNKNFDFKVSKNGAYTIYALNSIGNETVKTIYVDNIGTTPVISTDKNWQQEKEITIKYQEGYINEYSIDKGITWNLYTGSFIVEENTTIIARSKTQQGKYVDASSYQVTKIDKEEPTISFNLPDEIKLGTNIPVSNMVIVENTLSGTPEVTCRINNQQITNINSLEIGNYEISCTATTKSGVEKTITKSIEIKEHIYRDIELVVDENTTISTNTVRVEVDEEIESIPTPTKNGYEFKGWYLDQEYNNRVQAGDIAEYSNTRYYAKFEIVTYTITYVLNGGTQENNAKISYTIEDATFTLPSPTKNNYEFGGWYTKQNLSGDVQNQIEKGTVGNKEYYAKWIEKKYYVKFNGNGSTSGTMENQEIAIGMDTKLNANEYLKYGYNFLGWSTSSTATVASYIDEQTVKNLTQTSGETINLYAIWIKASFATDSWDTIVSNVRAGRGDYYKPNSLGKDNQILREVNLTTYGKHYLRVANTTPCSSTQVSTSGCGFIVEFATPINTVYSRYDNSERNIGGYPNSGLMYKLVTQTIYKSIPSEIRNLMINTTVISGSGLNDNNDENYISYNQKLYLLSLKEIYGSTYKDNWGNTSAYYDRAASDTRQLDYYSLNTNWSDRVIINNGEYLALRTASKINNTDYMTINSGGSWSRIRAGGSTSCRVAPAFRIGN